jgi:hypothetical protein
LLRLVNVLLLGANLTFKTYEVKGSEDLMHSKLSKFHVFIVLSKLEDNKNLSSKETLSEEIISVCPDN